MAIMTSSQRRIAPIAPHVMTRRIRDDLWRVTSASGLTLGYIAQVESMESPAFQARRVLPGGTTMVPIGSTWTLDDALACFTGP